ncbi:MAG: hypothetical protein WCF85_11830 [Rhodospirillaceae bacterium]
MITPAATIALSGALAQSTRVDAAAANIANSQTRGALSGQPAAYRSGDVSTTATAGGGTAAVWRPLTSSVVPMLDPTSPYADAHGMVAAPGGDTARDLVTLSSARTAYKANLKLAQAADEMTRETLKLTA